MTMNEVTRILSAIEQGDADAASQLLPLVYHELRQLASRRLALEKPGQTLQATALVHEAYLRLVDVDPNHRWNGRAHFFGAAAEAMRRILVENARKKRRVKHGGGLDRVKLEGADPAIDTDVDILALDDALDRLAKEAPIKAEVVKLRYFAGMSLEETATRAQHVPCKPTAQAPLEQSLRAWLYSTLNTPRRTEPRQPKPTELNLEINRNRDELIALTAKNRTIDSTNRRGELEHADDASQPRHNFLRATRHLIGPSSEPRISTRGLRHWMLEPASPCRDFDRRRTRSRPATSWVGPLIAE